jgi:hypothetical protein
MNPSPDPLSTETDFSSYDLKIKATLTLEAGDGSRIVEIAIDRILPEVFNPDFRQEAAASVRDALYYELTAPARAMFLAYTQKLRDKCYPRGRRLDEPHEDPGWRPMDEAGSDLINGVLDEAIRDHDLAIAS